uniref:CDC42 small effector protein homolog isoform X2 n=3 Tax=melanogaster group TaxID=32346 RepID=A0A6P4EI14_DRORH
MRKQKSAGNLWCVTHAHRVVNLAGSNSLTIDRQHYQKTETPSSQRAKGKMASTGEIWLQWFSCCFQQQRSPSRRPHQRLRIDRSMIGNPTNFVHTGHIGSADVELSANRLNAISTQMQSKGGYETNSIHSLHVS